MRANILSIAFLVVALCILGPRYLHQPWPPLRLAGAIIAFASLSLILVARIQLGRAFSIRAQASRLVTTGLYSRIRNPIYVFSTLFFVGIILFTQRLLLLLFFVVLIPVQIFRIRNEERALQEKFGAAFQDYKRQTWF